MIILSNIHCRFCVMVTFSINIVEFFDHFNSLYYILLDAFNTNR